MTRACPRSGAGAPRASLSTRYARLLLTPTSAAVPRIKVNLGVLILFCEALLFLIALLGHIGDVTLNLCQYSICG